MEAMNTDIKERAELRIEQIESILSVLEVSPDDLTMGVARGSVIAISGLLKEVKEGVKDIRSG